MLVPLLLVGCWDERLFKNSSIVSLAGFEGEMGDIKGYYAYPQATSKEMKSKVITGKGKSPRDVRQDAELKTEQTMDLSILATMLISDKTAEDDIYEYLDVYFRESLNPLTPRLALVKGELKPYFELAQKTEATTGEFYNRFIKSLEENSLVIPYNLQTAGSVLFESAQDLALPYLKMSDGEEPVLDGIALFSGRSFSGETISANQSIFLSILNNSLGKSARITYLYNESPVTFRINKISKKLKISGNEIEIDQKIKITIIEFPQDTLKDKKIRVNVEKFLTEKIEADLNEVMKTLQKAKSDAIGLGRNVRAYHSHLYKKNWNEHFATLNIPIKVQLEIVKTGILY